MPVSAPSQFHEHESSILSLDIGASPPLLVGSEANHDPGQGWLPLPVGPRVLPGAALMPSVTVDPWRTEPGYVATLAGPSGASQRRWKPIG